MSIETAVSSDNFSWDDKESVVVEAVDAIAVYRNEAGNVVIRQQDTLNHEDSFVVIPSYRLQSVLTALQNKLT